MPSTAKKSSTNRNKSKHSNKNRSSHSSKQVRANTTSTRRPSRQRNRNSSKSNIAIEDQKVIIFNKPYDVLSQFTDGDGRQTLANYIPIKDVYAAGRLDRDSEGLLILTNDGILQARLTQPQSKSWKTYWVQVDGAPSEEDLEKLRTGVELKDGMTLPAKIKIMEEPKVWHRDPPVRFRANIPTTWLEISIIEGRNRQVRRMTANIGFPTLRLIRYSMGNYELGDLKPGEWKEISPN